MKESTRRVKDILTPQGATPHPPRSLALVATGRLPFPKQAERDIALPDPPQRQRFPKEWQNSASRMEFFTCPHEFNSAHVAARGWHRAGPRQSPTGVNVACKTQQYGTVKGRSVRDSFTFNDARS